MNRITAISKRLFLFLFVAALACGTALPCFAWENTATGLENRPSPALYLSEREGSDGLFEGIFFDPSDTPEYMRSGEIRLYSYAERMSATETVRNDLQNAYSAICQVTSLGELTPLLENEAQSVSMSYTSAVFVVSDLFDISVEEEKLAALRGNTGYNLEVTFVYDLPDNGQLPVVIHQDPVERTWKVLESWRVTSQVAGTLTVKFDSLCPVAFLTVEPSRMDSIGNMENAGYIWIGVAAILLAVFAGTVILMTISHKRESGQKETKNADPGVDDEASAGASGSGNCRTEGGAGRTP